MMIPFGEYRPDAAPLAQNTTTLARNVVPGPDGDYLPLPSLIESAGPLPSRSRGTFGGRGPDGSTYMYCGDGVGLYQFGAGGWTDVSKSGGYTVVGDEQWEFTQFGDQVIAASWEVPLQAAAVTGGLFADLLTSTRKPAARHVGVVNRGWVVLGNCQDDVDGPRITRVWWLARGAPADADPDVVTQCDFEDLDTEDGQIEKVIGGEYGTIVMNKAIWRMTYEGPPTVYRFDRIVQNRGAIVAGGVVNFGRSVFFLDEDGFHVFDGVNSTPIGEGKVNRTILREMDRGASAWTCSAVYPSQSVVVWGIPTSSQTVTRLYLFNWKSGRWSEAEVSVESVFSAYSSPLFSDDPAVGDLLIDDAPQSEWLIDAADFMGGVTTFGAFTPDHRMRFFSGPAMEATIDTAEVQPFPGIRASVNDIRPIIDGSDASYVSVYTRETQGAVPATRGEVATNLIGSAGVLSQGRYLRARVRIPGGFSHAIGIDATFVQEGVR